METLLMSEAKEAIASPAGAWLEQAATADRGPCRISLASFPFRIGRGTTTDFRIDSSRVSREHATIEWDGGRYLVRDQGSTNGTFVNGRQITDVELHDGDALVIADVEFTFCSGEKVQPCDVATHVLGPTRRHEETHFDVVRGVRRLHEMLASRGIVTQFEPIVRLEDGQVLGYEALACEGPCEPPGMRRLAAAECRLNLRLHQLRRLISADQAANLPANGWLFMNVDAIEVGADELVDSLVQLRRALAEGQRLVVELPDSVVSDTPLLRDFYERMRKERIALAHAGFAAGAAQVRQLREIAPEYLKLSAGVAREASRQPERRRQLQDIVAASREIGAQVVATGIERAEEADLCRELGCPFAQGSFFQVVEQRQSAA